MPAGELEHNAGKLDANAGHRHDSDHNTGAGTGDSHGHGGLGGFHQGVKYLFKRKTLICEPLLDKADDQQHCNAEQRSEVGGKAEAQQRHD